MSYNKRYSTAFRKFALGRDFMRKEMISEVPFFLPSKDFFTPIVKESIKPGEWLAEHEVKGQTYMQYSRFNQIYKGRNTIYIVPLEDIEKNEYFRMSDLAEYIEAFFGGSATVKVMDTKKIKGFKKSIKEIRTRENDYGPQLFTPHVMKFLKKIVPADAYTCIALTSIDLFNKDSWNYVYGIASLKARTGVFSYRRYIGDDSEEEVELEKEEEEEGEDNHEEHESKKKNNILKSVTRLSAHEIGHQFGLKHCPYYNCMMQGFNGPNEALRKPPRLCPVCLRKLKKNCKFSVRERYLSLMRFYEKHIEGHEDQLEWVKKRLEYADNLVKKKTSVIQYGKMFAKMK